MDYVRQQVKPVAFGDYTHLDADTEKPVAVGATLVVALCLDSYKTCPYDLWVITRAACVERISRLGRFSTKSRQAPTDQNVVGDLGLCLL